jgi:hypothetical protein
MLSAIGGGALEVAGFELVYVTAPGDGVRMGLADAWALPLESVPRVRRFRVPVAASIFIVSMTGMVSQRQTSSPTESTDGSIAHLDPAQWAVEYAGIVGFRDRQETDK